MINGLRDLPSYYSLHDVWTREGEKFLELRTDPALRSEFVALDGAGRNFLQAISALRQVVGALQIELADKYKLPPVDPLDAIRV